ncbi:MAG TPA: DUF6266 family protein [Pedobacter sp.]|nr:DUF6266 family protein [Pedobacter sp.]
MGILRNGILGGFEKRTGAVVGRVYKGKNVVSAQPHQMIQALTEMQRKQRLSFTLVSQFLATFISLIRIGFGNDRKFFPMNLAMRYNFKRIVAGVYPDYEIRYEEVLFSRGSLCGPDSPLVVVEGNGLRFSWVCLAQNSLNRFNDRACFLAYSPAQKCSATAAYAAGRIDLGYHLVLPSAFAGDLLHCYMSFVSEKGKMVSDSVYLGTVQF